VLGRLLLCNHVVFATVFATVLADLLCLLCYVCDGTVFATVLRCAGLICGYFCSSEKVPGLIFWNCVERQGAWRTPRQ